VTTTGAAPLAEDLDAELGDYAWDLLPELTGYRAHNWHCFQDAERSNSEAFLDIRTPYATINTSLGCPFSCHYCCINAIFGRPRIRYWSLEKVFSWIDVLVGKYGVRNLRLDDELFVLSTKRVERFCDMMIDRGYDLNMQAYGRVDTINETLLPKMKKAGLNWVCLGIESANELVRNSVNKRIRKDIAATVRMIQAHGICVLGNYVFGLPEDTVETMEETLQLAVDLNCEFANFYSAMAYPGSVLYEQASREGGGCLPETWDGFSQHSYETEPLPTRYVSAKEVLRFRDDAYSRYFDDPRYLRYMRDRFGQNVEDHIRRMTQTRLERRLLGDSR